LCTIHSVSTSYPQKNVFVDKLSTFCVDKSYISIKIFFYFSIQLTMWIMWITYPQFLWISEIHQYFIRPDVDNFSNRDRQAQEFCTFCQSYPQISLIYPPDRLFGPGEKSPVLRIFPQDVIHRSVDMWITYPHSVWISLDLAFIAL